MIGARMLGLCGERVITPKTPPCADRLHMHRKQPHDRSGDLVLDRKGVFEFAIVALSPAMDAGRGVDRLGIDTNAVAGATNAALQHVARTKLARDLAHVDALALVPE